MNIKRIQILMLLCLGIAFSIDKGGPRTSWEKALITMILQRAWIASNLATKSSTLEKSINTITQT